MPEAASRAATGDGSTRAVATSGWSRSRVHRVIGALCGVGAVLLALHIRLPYLTGARGILHDTLVMATNFHLLFEGLVQGRLPLWDFQLNGGQPIWTTYELAPVSDPIALLVYGVAAWWGSPSDLAFQWVVFFWLLAFAAGGAFCARTLYRIPFVTLIVFLVLALGPVALSSVGQAWGFLAPFRYTPWVIWLGQRFLSQPSVQRGATLGAVAAISLASYQSAYPLPFMVVWFLTYLVWHRRAILPRWRAPGHRTSLSVAAVLVLPVLTALPLLAALPVWRALVPVGRVYSDSPAWVASLDMFAAWVDWSTPISCFHGCVYLGLLPTALAAAGFIAAGLGLWRGRWLRFRGVELAWVLATAIAIGTAFIPAATEAVLLGLRNWGFTFTLALFGLAVLATAACSRLPRGARRGSGFGLLVLLIVGADLSAFSAPRAYTLLPHVSGHLNWEVAPPDPFQRRIPILDTHQVQILDLQSPFLTEGPALLNVPVAFPDLSTRGNLVACLDCRPHAPGSTAISTQFLLSRYHTFVMAPVDGEHFSQMPSRGTVVSGAVKSEVMAVRRAPLYFATTIVPATDTVDALRALSRLEPQRLEKGIAVIELEPDAAQAAIAAGAEAPPADWSWDGRLAADGGLELEIVTDRPGFLILANNYDPYWRAWVDGQDTPVRPANVTNQAVAVEAGRHLVRLSYQPVAYVFAFKVRAAATLVAVGLILFGIAQLQISAARRWMRSA